MKNLLQKWLLASRPKTLPAAIAPAVIGNVLAFRDGNYDLLIGFSCVVISLIMQVLANFANDLFDHEKGTDTPDRLGPTRATASGLISVNGMRTAIAIIIAIAGVFAIPLIMARGWIVIILGLIIVISALLYSGGKTAYGYHGLGDLFVFVFFGLMATIGTYYMISGKVTEESVVYSITMGALIVNILVVNNTRDRITDQVGGKNTLAVKLGRNAMNWEFLINLFVAFGLIIAYIIVRRVDFATLIVFLSLPLARKNFLNFIQKEGRELNSVLAETARFTIIFALLLSAGLLLGY
ncbi:MAG TPA: 1,4-dihydroxy-2-naphthoate polyprenyltransferase [Anaerolineales bacterium]|nr:1,4-dihydroxy-2-naphthoate polyprenyltransferase [Anaerolineales bacterium]